MAEKKKSAPVSTGPVKPEDKKKALETALAQIEKNFGKGAIMRLGDDIPVNVEAISTGSLSLDLALGIGGVPRGRIVEIYGPESSGKTTLALHILASAQKKGGEVAFIDVEHALEPAYARALGVDIDSLLISQPDTGEQALEITEQLVRSGALDVVVVDSVAALLPRSELEGEMGESSVGVIARLMSQALRKLDETPELMPMPISLAHKLAKKLTEVRKSGELDYLRPDGKSQVTVEYVDGKPVRVDAVVISSQHSDAVSMEQLRADVMEKVIKATIPAELLDENTKYYINPTGRFVVGGPQGDTGLTGRKIIVDTYGGYARHGGGAFSGKDPSKVDRSAAYATRWVAKNIVAAGLAKQCEVQVAYAIGVAKPVSIMVDTFGTGVVADEKIEQAVEKVFDLTPAAIIRDLDLRKPIYRKLAAYGHMGREDLGVKWENTDRVEELKAAVAAL